MRMVWGIDKSAMTARHILFQDEDKDTYVRTMIESVLADVTS